MSRTDVKRLVVPELPQQTSGATPVAQSAEPSKVNTILDAMEQSANLDGRCASCKGRLSKIEMKMGRCLTCGKDVSQGGSWAKSPSLRGSFKVHL